jgi:dihydrofolate reductase
VYIAASVDGYIARPDGGIDWLDRVQLAGEDYGFAAFYDTVDTLVMGRGTYDKALTFPAWPYAGKRVAVMTHRPARSRFGETFVSGTPAEVLAQLGDGARAYVDGGVVIRQFLAAHLIDDLTISVIPIILGAGIRLFPGGEGEHALTLESSQSWPSGLVQLRYRS